MVRVHQVQCHFYKFIVSYSNVSSDLLVGVIIQNSKVNKKMLSTI